MKYIVSIDIGGTTFNSGIFTDSLNQVAISEKDKIRFYKSKNDVVNAIVKQVNNLIDSVNISKTDILGLGVGAPGPLDPKKGVILDTPNLRIFKNYHITYDLTKKLRIDTFIENDANLFALGEWLLSYKKNDVVLGITLGTGLGFGLVVNGQSFTGGNGMAMEYGLSPFKWGMAEENVCIEFIRNRSRDLFGRRLSPIKIEKLWYEGDDKAKIIYREFGENLGVVLSHVINMIDPQVISIGGGLSKAFDCFKNTMFEQIKVYSPSYNVNQIIIARSKLRELSTMVGACQMVKEIKKKT
ncbi:ROK family protein [Candidatus Marinimicrobia bacterium]|nr:ROK family protein [Candidatus Neomarinimicrobiota bacterium]